LDALLHGGDGLVARPGLCNPTVPGVLPGLSIPPRGISLRA
jgi:hypothetical protein